MDSLRRRPLPATTRLRCLLLNRLRG